MNDCTQPSLGDDRLPLRFWSKVEASSEGCWTWTASTNQGGYGIVRHDGKNRKAHRLAYAALVGPIPSGLVIDHLCRNRACVNPLHLEPVTLHENILRGVAPAARNARVESCRHGHEFSAENTYIYTRKDGRVGRYCIECRRQYRLAA